MSRYILEPRYSLRGWEGLPFALFDNEGKRSEFLPKDLFVLLVRCDGMDDIDDDALDERQRGFLQEMEREQVIRKVERPCILHPRQQYKTYPCRYKRDVHWSITGRCNYRCKHCLVSAPHAKFGHPTTEQLLDLVDQMAECGIGGVSLTGGEPLIRDDFWQIVDALCDRGLGISMIFSNGYLVNDELLDGLERRGLKHVAFQMSFDGLGWHDWLRGFDGAEVAVDRAFRLLQKRGYHADAAMCLHRKNAHTIRDTVNYLASLGVTGLKINRIQELGEWKDAEEDIALTEDESLELYLDYLPQYFEDGAPLSITLDGAFSYEPLDRSMYYGYERHCEVDPESERRLSCAILRSSMYIGPDGRVCPCMSMTVQEQDEAFPSVFEQPLREILGYTPFMDRCAATVGQVRDANPECRECKWVSYCHGGCRAAAYNDGGSYYAVDPGQCHYFKAGWFEKFKAVAESARDAYYLREGIEPPTEGQR